MKTLTVQWTGIRPLIVHNERLADPLDEYTKAVKRLTEIKKKSEEIHEQIARTEWEGGFYWDDKDGPVMPSKCIERCIVAGAMKARRGGDCKSGILMPEPHARIEYDGPRTHDAMWKERKRYAMRCGCVVNGKRIIRTRPMFPTGWRILFTLEYDPSLFGEEPLKQAIETAGLVCGLCEWRPKFGRFLSEF